MKLFIAMVSLILAGCESTTIVDLQPDELSAIDTPLLCNAYVKNHRPAKLRVEIERRDLITEEEWALVEVGDIALGMSIPALFCSLGLPQQFTSRPAVDLIRNDSATYVDTGTGRILVVTELDLESGSYRIRYPRSRHSKGESVQVITKRGKVSSWGRRYYPTVVPSMRRRPIPGAPPF